MFLGHLNAYFEASANQARRRHCMTSDFFCSLTHEDAIELVGPNAASGGIMLIMSSRFLKRFTSARTFDTEKKGSLRVCCLQDSQEELLTEIDRYILKRKEKSYLNEPWISAKYWLRDTLKTH
jgi:hypothetical protein